MHNLYQQNPHIRKEEKEEEDYYRNKHRTTRIVKATSSNDLKLILRILRDDTERGPTLNFSLEEESCLLSLVMKNKEIINCKKTGAIQNRYINRCFVDERNASCNNPLMFLFCMRSQKKEVWQKIEEEFNVHSIGTSRNAEALHTKSIRIILKDTISIQFVGE